MKVLVLNEGYSDNLGDQAINDSLHFILRENNINEIIFYDFTKNVSKPIEIKMITHNKKFKSFVFQFKKLIPSKVKWLIKNYARVIDISKRKYDLVVIGGGQLLLSNATFAIAMFCWVCFLRLFGNKNIVLFAVGSGPKFSVIDKLLFRYILNNVSDVYVRDQKSQALLKELFGINAKFVYDVAFIHNKIYKVDITKKNNILLGLVSLDVYNRYNKERLIKEEFFETWIRFLGENNIQLKDVKLFYTTKNDRDASLEFQKYIFDKYQIKLTLIETNTKEKLVNELAKSEMVISARMHALILGLTYNSKILTYPISDKLKEFYAMFDSNFELLKIQDNINLKIKEILNG